MYIIKIYTLALMTYGYGYTVDRATLDFGTPDNSHCGFCKTPCNGKWRGGELQQDIICDYCGEEWYLDEDDNAFYIRSNSHRAALSIESLIYTKSYEGFRDVPLLEWFFYYDNDQLRSAIVRRNWVRSKYRYWDYDDSDLE